MPRFAAFVLLPLALAGLAGWLVDPLALANRSLERFERIAGGVLQQKLSVGSLEGHVSPELDVTVRDLVLSSQHAGEPPMLVVPSLRLRFDWRRALATAGRELPLELVRIEGALLRVRRDHAGRLDVLDVLRRLPALDPRDLAGGVLAALSIEHAQLRLMDEEGREIVVDDLHVETHGPVALGQPLHASATASGGAAQLHVLRLPEDLVLWPPPPASAHAELRAVPLARAVAWLGLPQLFAGGVVDVRIDAATTPTSITGALDVQGQGIAAAVAANAGADVVRDGSESEASLRADVRVAVDGFRTEIDGFAFQGAGIGIEGSGVFRQASLEGIESIDVMVRTAELARLGLLIPPLRDTAPGALRLAGAGSGSLQASPGELRAELDLDGARVVIGDVLSKQAGERLRVSLRGTRDSSASSLPPPSSPGRIDASVRAELPDGVRIAGELAWQPFGVDEAFFDLTSDRAPLARAASLSPVLRDMVDGSVRRGSLSVGLRGRMSALDNAFDFALSGQDLRIELDRTTIDGAALVNIAVRTDARGLRLQGGAKLDGVSIETLGDAGQLVFEKPAGRALGVRASLVEVDGRGSMGRALAQLDAAARQGGAVFAGHGLSPRWRRIALGMDGRGSVRMAHAVWMGVPLADADMQLSLRSGRLRLAPAIVRVFAGRASLRDSVVDLRAEPPSWSIALDAQEIELAQVLEPIHALTGEVEGRAAVRADLRGTGLSLESLLGSLDGPVVVRVHEARIAAVDALSNTLEGVWSFLAALPGVSRSDVEKARGPSLADALREGEWSARFRANQLRFDRPILTLTSLGLLTLAGHAALDGSLELRARLDMKMGDAEETVPVEALVRGTWTKPELVLSNFDRILP